MTGAPDPSPATANTEAEKTSDLDSATPHARYAEPMQAGHDHLHDKQKLAEDRQEALVDEGVEETFPASDPVSAKRIT